MTYVLPPDLKSMAQVRENEPLSSWTTFRLGGPCLALISCPSSDLLVRAHHRLTRADIPFVLIGGGSNLLVSDAGLDAVILRFSGSAPMPVRDGVDIEVDGGFRLDALSAWCVEQGVAGLGFSAGIPGTVAGAVAGNAGAFGRQMSDVLRWADLLAPDGRFLRAGPDEMAFSYRRCGVVEEGYILLRMCFRLARSDTDALEKERRESLSFRARRHPDWRRMPCAGSFFRNLEPTSAAARRQAAGWYLEQAGVGAFREGGARVFERHCNMIVADGPNVTARDVAALAQRMASAVFDRFSIRLEREVRCLGFEA